MKTVLGLATLGLVSIASGSGGADYNSQSHWGGECQSKKRQSPIDIKDSSKSCSDLKWNNYDTQLNWNVKLTENGFVASLPPSNNEEISLVSIDNGNPEFILAQFHCHWGVDDTAGSEHRFNENQYGFECHFVHYLNDYKNEENPLSKALEDGSEGKKQTLAVYGVAFDVVHDDNLQSDTNQFFGNISDVGFDGVHVMETLKYSIKNIIGNIDYNDFHFYHGSLTTPPCTPCVNWHVSANHPKISSEVMRQLRYQFYAVRQNYRDVHTETNEHKGNLVCPNHVHSSHHVHQCEMFDISCWIKKFMNMLGFQM